MTINSAVARRTAFDEALHEGLQQTKSGPQSEWHLPSSQGAVLGIAWIMHTYGEMSVLTSDDEERSNCTSSSGVILSLHITDVTPVGDDDVGDVCAAIRMLRHSLLSPPPLCSCTSHASSFITRAQQATPRLQPRLQTALHFRIRTKNALRVPPGPSPSHFPLRGLDRAGGTVLDKEVKPSLGSKSPQDTPTQR